MSFSKGLLVIVSGLTVALFGSGQSYAEQWPGFRGVNASGVSEGKPTPVTWNVANGENVKWKTPIPGLAHSSPAIWDDTIFVTTAVSSDEDPELRVGLFGNIDSVENDGVHEWRVYCIDKNTGKIRWMRAAHKGVPKMKRHPKSTHANPTPATNGKYVVAFFASEGLYCYDFEGNLIWSKDLGALDSSFFKAPTAQWGFASSPIIHDNVVIVQCDVLNGSFLAAFDIATGKQRWRTPREDVPTWSTPSIYTEAGKQRVVVNGFKHIGGYDFQTGKEVWRLEGSGDIPVPTPVIAHDLIYIHSAHGPGSPIYAIKTNAQGDISLAEDATKNEGIAWSVSRGGAYLVTAIVYGDYLYNCRNNGRLSCFNAKTGELMYQERIGKNGGGFSASPVASGGHLYLSSEHGSVFVLKAGPKFEVVATNSMDDICMATPAISEGTLYFRTRHNLIALEDKSE